MLYGNPEIRVISKQILASLIIIRCINELRYYLNMAIS